MSNGKWIRFLCLLELLVLALCLPVKAAEMTGSLSVTMMDRETPLEGETLVLYRVTDSSGTATHSFRDCDVLFDADILLKFANDRGISVVSKCTDGSGMALFEDLEPGLYLVAHSEQLSGHAVMRPFLLCIPMEIDGTEIWNVEAFPKTEIPEPETEIPSDTKLPQTGQRNWLVPVLTAAGLGMVALGQCLNRKSRQDETDPRK